MTHDQLVERAVRWLKNGAKLPRPTIKWVDNHAVDGPPELFTVKCPLVLSEFHTHIDERPDAIGFLHSGGTSILVECKVSESDYYADRQKPFRKDPDKGVGNFRWFLTPKGLVRESMSVPAGWGLLEVCGRVIRVRKWATEMKKDSEAETIILYSVVNRLNIGADDYCKPIRTRRVRKQHPDC